MSDHKYTAPIDSPPPTTLTKSASGEPGLSYRPGLDGLRAIAVLAVLVYHGSSNWLPGGFLGVEVFFVISGYLITSLLLAEWERHGSISLPHFWLRRARRLLPALFVLLVAVMAVGAIFLRDEVAGLRNDVAAAGAYVTNWYLIFSNKSYFETIGRPSLLQHLWSLAVEEQFYILWPPVLLVGLRLFKRRGLLPLVVMGAAASAGLMALLYTPDADPSRVYYGTDTRAAGLLVGAALAFVWVPARLRPAGRVRTVLLDLLGLAGLGGIAGFFFGAGQYTPMLYLGGFALLDVCTALAIAPAVHPSGRLGSRLLGNWAMRWVGLRSYSIYLWHWPVFMLTRPGLDVALDGLPLFGLRLAITLLLADLSYRLVEVPARKGAIGRIVRSLFRGGEKPAWRLGVRRAGAMSALSGLALLSVSVAASQPPPRPAYLPHDSVDIVFGVATPTAGRMPAASRSILTSTPVLHSAAGIPMPTRTPDPAPSSTRGATPVPTQEDYSSVASRLGEPGLDVAPTATTEASPTRGAEAPALRSVALRACNLRTGPSTKYPVITWLVSGEAVTLLGEDAGGNWYKLRSRRGVVGWAFAGYIVTRQAAPATATVVNLIANAPSTKTAQPEETAQPTATIEATQAPAGGQGEPTETALATPAGMTPEPAPVRVTAIGDSVMLGAASALGLALGNVEVDAAVSRQASTATKILQERRASGRLGEVVVIHMGTNGPLTAGQFDQMMAPLSGIRRVIIVNLKVPREWEEANNAVIAAGVARYENTVLVDWHSVGMAHPEFFYADGIHLKPAGAKEYAGLIAQAVGR